MTTRYKYIDNRPSCGKTRCKNKADINDKYHKYLCASCYKETYR